MKVKARTAAVVAPLPPAAKTQPKPAVQAKATLHVEKQRNDGKLSGEVAADWKGLAGVSKGSLFGEATPVEAMLSRYGLDPPSRPLEKFFDALAFIDSSVQGSKDPKKVAASLMTHDSRREVFRLESLLRLYKPELGEHLPLVKELEDHLGAVSAFDNTLKHSKGAPPIVLERITELRDAAAAAVVDLVKTKWMPGADGVSKPVEKLAQAFAATDLGSAKADRKTVATRIAAVIDKVKDDSKELSMSDLDGGVHKLRRQLRWIALYMESSGGLVQSKGADLPPLKKGDEPIQVPKELFKQLQDLIEKLGDIKDDCEHHELLASAYQELGMDPKELGKKGTPEDMEKRATVLYDELNDTKLLKKLRNVFEEA